MVPPMVIPNIATDDPAAILRTRRLNKEIARQERKLSRINSTSVGMGKRAITVELLASESGNTTEFLPRHQMKQGKPYICMPMAYNEIPTFAGDALFTSTSRADYHWKAKKRRDTKNRRPYDDFYKFRDAFCGQKACLRSV